MNTLAKIRSFVVIQFTHPSLRHAAASVFPKPVAYTRSARTTTTWSSALPQQQSPAQGGPSATPSSAPQATSTAPRGGRPSSKRTAPPRHPSTSATSPPGPYLCWRPPSTRPCSSPSIFPAYRCLAWSRSGASTRSRTSRTSSPTIY